MNKLMLLACIVLVADLSCARPDLSLGYRYNQGHSSGGADFLQAAGPNSYAPFASGNNYYNGVASGFGRLPPPNFRPDRNGVRFTKNYNNFNNFNNKYNNNFNYNKDFTSGPLSPVNYDEQQAYFNPTHHHEEPIITKHFYIHSAPIDHDEAQIVRHINVGRPQKNYRVVFIDAPTSTVTKTKIIANVAPVEDKTAIYVLSKKATAADVSAEIVTPAPDQSKPEVYYIKYKTPEEAIHAQHTIQAQYDALGGTSDVSNEGIIPYKSVIGSLDHDIPNGQFHGEPIQNIDSVVSDLPIIGNNQPNYLPPLHKK